MEASSAIDDGAAFDFGRTSADYARYRDIYPEEFYRHILDWGLCTNGQKVLDLGTGTGVLPRAMYRFGAKFTGADISENQIAEARRLSAGMGIDYIAASAETVDFPAAAFDVVTACQCFIYFDQKTAMPRIHRMLKPGGHLLILWLGWRPDEDPILHASVELCRKHNPQQYIMPFGFKPGEPGIPDVLEPFFSVARTAAYDISVPFTREAWHGRMKASRGVGASNMPPEAIAAWEEEHLAFLDTVPEPLHIAHYVTMVDLQREEIS